MVAYRKTLPTDDELRPVDRHIHKVHFRHANETGDEQIGGPVVEFLRRGDLHDAPGLHDADTVAHGHGFRLIVRHVDDGRREALRLQLAMQIGNAHTHGSAQLRIEI